MKPRVTVLDYGAGNLRSVVRAFEHTGAEVRLTDNPVVAAEADRLVLPGQGHFGQCMGRLEASGLGDVVREHVASGRPFLGICVGMQLLYEGSEEATDAPGLGLLSGRVERLRTDLPLPHVGWNSVQWTRPGDALLRDVDDRPRFFYHVHSFALHETDAPEVLGRSEYQARFASVVGRDAVWGIQFHPEKSQEDGLHILGNFARL